MVLDGTGSVYDDTGWYLVSISWYCLILGGTWSAKGLYACIYWKKWRFGRVLPMPHTQTTEYSATQLVYSIKFKLSHTIYRVIILDPPLPFKNTSPMILVPQLSRECVGSSHSSPVESQYQKKGKNSAFALGKASKKISFF